jgi:hypothetical protein
MHQSQHQSAGLRCKAFGRARFIPLDQLELNGKDQLRFQLGERAERNVDVVDVHLSLAAAIAFREIARNRNGGPAKLLAQAELFGTGKSIRKQ